MTVSIRGRLLGNAPDPVPSRTCRGRAGGVLFSFSGRQRLLRILKAQRQLIGIELFRAAAEAMALQRLNDGSQPGAFSDRGVALLLNPSNRLRMPHSLGQQQSAQGI